MAEESNCPFGIVNGYKPCCCKCKFQKKKGECHAFVECAAPSRRLMKANIQKICFHSLCCELFIKKETLKIRRGKKKTKYEIMNEGKNEN